MPDADGQKLDRLIRRRRRALARARWWNSAWYRMVNLLAAVGSVIL
jgi:hypothetical protein